MTEAATQEKRPRRFDPARVDRSVAIFCAEHDAYARMTDRKHADLDRDDEFYGEDHVFFRGVTPEFFETMLTDAYLSCTGTGSSFARSSHLGSFDREVCFSSLDGHHAMEELEALHIAIVERDTEAWVTKHDIERPFPTWARVRVVLEHAELTSDVLYRLSDFEPDADGMLTIEGIANASARGDRLGTVNFVADPADGKTLIDNFQKWYRDADNYIDVPVECLSEVLPRTDKDREFMVKYREASKISHDHHLNWMVDNLARRKVKKLENKLWQQKQAALGQGLEMPDIDTLLAGSVVSPDSAYSLLHLKSLIDERVFELMKEKVRRKLDDNRADIPERF